MSILTRAIASPFKLMNEIRDDIAKERRLRLSDGAGWSSFFGRTSTAGKQVTQTTAMQVAAVWACVKITSQAVSALPLSLYEKQGTGGREKLDDQLAEVLTEAPNRDQTALEFWEGQTAWLLTSGNAYAERLTIRDRLVGLDPLGGTCRPHRTEDGELEFLVKDRGKTERLPREKVFHIRGFGQALQNRDMGMSPIAFGANSIGAAIASQEAAASTFANGMRPTGFFTYDSELSDEQRARAMSNLVEPFRGSNKAGAVGILEAGFNWQAVSMNPEDMQMLETRRFDVEEICRWFGVPPIIIGHAADGQTMWGSGVEQILLSWLTLGIDPICDRIEARVRKDLIRPTGRKRVYAEFNREALLQMDSKAKAAFLAAMVQNGLMDRNEGREKLNLSHREGADVLTAQTNLAPLDRLGADGAGQQAQAAMRAWLEDDKEIDDDNP